MQGKEGAQWTEITKPAMIVGRNNIPVPPDEVEHMAQLGCPNTEIADYFGITPTALHNNFKDFLAKGRAHLKQTLRRAQIQLALGGNAVMLIWLGKNILGQTDSPQTAEKEVLPFTDEEIDDIKEELEDELEQLDATE